MNSITIEKEKEETKNGIKKVVLGEHIFYLGDVLEVLNIIEDKSVDLVFTSPPYNVGKPYENHNDLMPYEEYLKWLESVLEKIYSKLKDDGRFVINIPSITCEGEYKPLFVDVINICHKIGFKIRNDIIWYKHQVSKRTAWGSFGSPSDPYVVQPYEFILVFNKKYKKHAGKKENIDITKEEFIEFSNALWEIKPETRKEVLEACPAPFPEELAYRVVKFYTFVGDTVLDPFGGSGTTNKVCAELGRKSIYIDNSKKAFDFAIKRVKMVLATKRISEFINSKPK
ncbi:MAG: site-specific DNA-methyltransferase [Candidatus Aenigmatarchaeota archaeon]